MRLEVNEGERRRDEKKVDKVARLPSAGIGSKLLFFRS